MSAGIILKDCFKNYTLDQDKIAEPSETTAKAKKLLAEAGVGILAETVRIDNGRLDIPVFISRCGGEAVKVMPTKKQMGKGATPAQAEASAVMELVERFSFFNFLRHEKFLRATYDQVKDRAMPFEHIAASVHHDPKDLDRALHAFLDLELSWTPALNLTDGREYLIPINWFFEINEFNGPAAGAALEEAIIQGICEVVERHVSALACRGKLVLPTIDPDSLINPAARELTQKFARQGVKLFAKDFSLGMDLATVGALAYDPATFPVMSEIVFTAGTAPDPEKAYIRALTEVAQLAGDFNTGANFVASGLPKYTSLSQAEYITSPGPLVPIQSLPNLGSDNFKTEIETAVSRLASKGFDVYVLNVSNSKLNLPVVYTIIPGAHFRERAVGSSVPFFAAKILFAEQDQARSIHSLDSLRDLYPQSYYLNFFEGQALLTQERPQLAIPLFQAALEMSPPEEDQAGLLTYLGLAFKELEQYSKAVETLKRSLALDPERRDTFNLLGFCYFKLKEHEKAIDAFEQVLKLDPGSGIDYANLGSNYRELGRFEEAVHYYGIALKLDPSLTWVRDNLARLGQPKI